MDNANQCDLCGTHAGVQSGVTLEPEPVEVRPAQTPVEGVSISATGAKECASCGHKNQAAARFCNQCGSALAGTVLPPVAPKVAEALPRRAKGEPAVNRQVGLLVGGSVLVVVALFLITVFSQNQSAPPPNPLSNTQSGASDERVDPPTDDHPLSAELQARVRPLMAAIEGSTDPVDKRNRQEELIQVYLDEGRYDFAGGVQYEIAEAENTAEAWARAGNLYYDWMDRHEGSTRINAAKTAIAAYQRSLELDPDNLDVRTDMGAAYLNDPDNPMQAIQQTNQVLAQNPDHIQANFNKGVMLIQIRRLDQAQAQFEKVKELSQPGSVPYDRAQQYLDQIRGMQ
jgi:tetratricopeptide (TPR) repeat protein